MLYNYFTYTGRLFFGCGLSIAPCNIIRASCETKKERLNYRKKYIEQSAWGTSLFWLHAPLSMSFFVAFFVYSLPYPKWRTCWMTPMIHSVVMDVILCDDIMSERLKIENLLQFNTSWLESLKTWYYLDCLGFYRLCFTFCCSGYDLTLIKKSHTLNCYWFLQKFLLK